MFGCLLQFKINPDVMDKINDDPSRLSLSYASLTIILIAFLHDAET